MLATEPPTTPATNASPAPTVNAQPLPTEPATLRKSDATAPIAPDAVAKVVDRVNPQQIGDILGNRLTATAQWLSQQADNKWTLQTLSTTSEQDLRDYLRFIWKSIEINSIYVYRHANNAGQTPVLSVTYGTYDTKADAERALGELPAQLKANRPMPLTVQSIRAMAR